MHIAIPDGQLVGLSVRLCIDDIIHRRLGIDRVETIFSEFECPDRKAWESMVMVPGMHTWWVRDPTNARRLLDELINDGRITQTDDDPPEFEPGHHWIPIDF